MNRSQLIKDRLHDVEFHAKKQWWGEDLTILDDPATCAEPLVVRKALACRFVLNNMPAELKPDELIAGICRMSMIGFGHTFPQYALPEEIADAARVNLSPLSVWGHQPPNYEKVLAIGLSGLRVQVQDRLDAELDAARPDTERTNLFRAMIIGLDAIRDLAARYATMCEAAARAETDPARRAELAAMAERCARVPEHPATSFAEALQCVWFIYIALQSTIENIPLGRIDQYLMPYYTADIERGALEASEAEELVVSFLAKFNERVQLDPELWEDHNDPSIYSFGSDPSDHSMYIDLENGETYNYGVSANHWDLNVILAGVRPDGVDGTNELTYLFLRAWDFLKVVTPVVSVRLNHDSPEELYRACADILRVGTGEPVLYNETPIIDAYVRLGIPVEDARDFSNDGCWETLIPGKSHYSFSHIEVLQLLEYVFQRGQSLVRGVKEGLDLGDPAHLETWEQFYAAFKAQLDTKVEEVVENRMKYYGASYRIAPDPIISTLIDGCIESGKDLTDGGAQYTIYSPLLTGVSDCVDALAAVKKLVYDERKVSMAELAEAQRTDFAGREPLQHMLRNRAPKFGNDDGYADDIARRLVADFEAKVQELNVKHPEIVMPLGIGTFENYSKFGHKVGASASGRAAQAPIGSNYSPAFGMDKSGPTAAVKSVVAPDLWRFATGAPLDIQVNAGETSGEPRLQRLVGLIKGFLDVGGNILTITGVSTEMLLDAQKHPEKYRTLRVRMGGLSAYFIALPKEMQDTLISKTKFSIG
ncbi:MAG: pyruvate formate lyase family protein [Tetrasphaera sp.]